MVLVLAGVLLTWGYFALRDLDDELDEVLGGTDFPTPVGLLSPAAERLGAVEASSGREVWRRDFRHGTRLVGAAGDLVLLHEDLRLVAVDAVTGEETWRQGPELVASCWPIVVGETVVGATFDDEIIARDGQSGSERWRSDLRVRQCGRFVGSGGIVIVDYLFGSRSRSRHGVTAFDAVTGARQWSIETRSVLLDGTANGLFFVWSREGTIEARDVTTGGLRWSWTPPTVARETPVLLAPIRAVPAGPTVGFSVPDPQVPADEFRTITVFVGTDDGTERWRTKSGAASSFSYDAATGTLVEVGEPPVPTGRDPATGAVRWMGTRRGGSVVTADGVAFVENGDLEALDAESGASRWMIRDGRIASAPPLAVAGGLLLLGAE